MLLPGYVTPAAARPARVMLGSEGGKRSSLTVRDGHPHVGGALATEAIAHAARYALEFIRLPQLDDQQFTAVLPWVPAGHRVVEDHDTVLSMEFGSFDDYVAALSRAGRQRLHREVRAFRDAGFGVEPMHPVDVAALVPLLGQVLARHGGQQSTEEIESYLASLLTAFGERAHELVARTGGRLAAFQVLCDMGAEWWHRCYGCDYQAPRLDSAYVYFNLAIYESVRWAVMGGANRVCLGAGSLEVRSVKTRRGARLRALRTIAFDGGDVAPLPHSGAASV